MSRQDLAPRQHIAWQLGPVMALQPNESCNSYASQTRSAFASIRHSIACGEFSAADPTQAVGQAGKRIRQGDYPTPSCCWSLSKPHRLASKMHPRPILYNKTGAAWWFWLHFCLACIQASSLPTLVGTRACQQAPTLPTPPGGRAMDSLLDARLEDCRSQLALREMTVAISGGEC